MNEPQHWAEAYAATADADHVCLAPEALLAAWDVGADALVRARAVAAVAACAQCAAVAQIARDLQQHLASDTPAFAEWAAPPRVAEVAFARAGAAADGPDELAAARDRGTDAAANDAGHALAPVSRRPRCSPAVLRWAAAAVVVLGIGSLSLTMRQPAEPPAVRSESAGSITPASGSRLRAAPAQLTWSAIGSAGAYRVELYDDSARSLWRSERVSATAVDLPHDLRAQLQRGTFLWRVRAEGSEVEIGPFFFRVEP
jgi:hypothetical protein